MNLNNKNIKKDPSKKEIELILKLFNSKKFTKAKQEVDKKIINYQNSPILYNILGAILAAENKSDQAILSYKKAIKNNSNYAEAYNNLGITLLKLKKSNEATQYFKDAIKLKNDFAEAFNNLGNAILETDGAELSIQYYEKAIQIRSNYAEAFYNLGNANYNLNKKEIALKNFSQALKINPKYAEAHNNLGILYCDLNMFDKAMDSYNAAIKIKPNSKFYNNLGSLFTNLNKFEEASLTFNKAIEIKPDYAIAYSNLLLNLNYKTNFNNKEYLLVAKKFGLNCKSIKEDFFIKHRYEKKPKKLALGFLSADFGNHPGGFFSLSTIKEFKKKNFDLVAYSTTNRKDDYSHSFKKLFTKWNSVEKKSDKEIIELIINDGIHILIDHQGHTSNNRLPIFIYKPAPIQITWLGQGSSGIKEIDYMIGSNHTISQDEEKDYIEKIIRLPEISQCFTPPEFDLNIKSLPAIKNNFITFGCLNKITKINEQVIALWSKILLSNTNTKLLIKSKNLGDFTVAKNIIESFKNKNIEKDRLILRGESKTRKEVLETYNEIDIALDPFPFQGNTSTCEALWMGVPVLTLKGNRYLSHFGESINANLNLHNWIAKNESEYLSKAINFASDVNFLSTVRKNLRKKFLQSPVCDAQRFTEHFSKILWDIWNKHCSQN